MGDLLPLLKDPCLVELMVNEDGSIWIEKLGKSMEKVGFFNQDYALGIIETIAGFHKKIINQDNPILESEFPLDGSRFSGQIPPIVSAPIFSIRKRAISVFSLDDYVKRNIMTEREKDIISEAISEKKNILIIGGTGSGKTTLVNAVIEQITSQSPNERIFIIEDTGEIQCSAKNKIHYRTSSSVDMTQLLKTSLRMRPDRICVGEIRGSEALDLLDAWNTGHEGGVATLHANNSRMGIDRLRSLISRNKYSPKDIDFLIGKIIDVVIHISRSGENRKIKEILLLEEFRPSEGFLFKKIN